MRFRCCRLGRGPARPGSSLRQQHGHVAVGSGSDLLAFLAALGAEFRRLALALGLHALVDGLAVLLGQVGAADAHVDDLDAERPRIVIELIAHQRAELLALVAHHVGERRGAEHAAQRRVEQDSELRTGASGADGLIELERIDDAVAREGIDHEPLAGLAGAGIEFVLARRDHLLGRRFDVENAFVDIDHAVDERHFHVQSRFGDDAHRIAEAHHQRLPGLVDGEEGAVAHEDGDQQHDGEHAAGKAKVSLAAPCRRVARCRRRRWPRPIDLRSAAGIRARRRGRPVGPVSMMGLLQRDHENTFSMVSRYMRRRVTSGTFACIARRLAGSAKSRPWLRRPSARDRLRRPGCLGGAAARLRDDAIGISLRRVLRALEMERAACTSRKESMTWAGDRPSALDLPHQDAGAVSVEGFLHQVLDRRFDFLPRAVRIGCMFERPITSRMAVSATAFTVPSGFWMLNRYWPRPSA